MQVLIDHGAWRNFGDLAMLEGVCSAYERQTGTKCFVVNDRLQFSRSEMAALGGQPVELGRKPNIRLVTTLRGLRGYHRLIPAAWRSRIESSISVREIARNGGSAYDEKRGEEYLKTFCAQYDALHISGGGYMTDTFPGVVYEKVLLMQAFANAGKPVVLTGQQLGPFRSNSMRRLVCSALAPARYIGLREPHQSQQICASAGVTEAVHISGDDSFGLQASKESVIDEVLDQKGLKGQPFLAANLRIADYSPEHEKHIECFARMVRQVSVALGVPVLIVPICFGAGESDVDAGYRLKSLPEGSDFAVLDSPNLTPAIVKGVLARAAAGVGASYHFCTFCLSQGVPAVSTVAGTYYVQKAQGLADYWSHPEICLKLNETDAHSGARHILDFVQNARVREDLQTRSQMVVSRWADTMASIIDDLNGSMNAIGA